MPIPVLARRFEVGKRTLACLGERSWSDAGGNQSIGPPSTGRSMGAIGASVLIYGVAEA